MRTKQILRVWIACLVAGIAAHAQTNAPSTPPSGPTPVPAPEVSVPAPAPTPAPAPDPAPASVPAGDTQQLISLTFRDAPLEQVLAFYEELTGLTLLRAPNLGAAITLRGQTRLTKEEALAAIESVLSMNNIQIVPMGNRFAKVVQAGTARQEGLAVRIGRPEAALPETDAIESRILDLKHIALAEALPILQTLIRGTGKIQPIDRTNSLLVTDTSGNLQRIIEVLDFIDRPEEARVETRVFELRNAKAGEVAQRLNELIADSQAQAGAGRAPGAAVMVQPVPNAPPGVIRAQRLAQTPEGDAADRGIVTGRIKIVADERTNILIILSRPENFTFFDRIIVALDRPVDPEVILRVYPLDYADAEETAGLLNEFLGKSSSSTADADRKTADRGAAGEDATDTRGQALRDYIARRADSRPAAAAAPAAGTAEGTAGIGQISPQTKILSDKRSNSLLLMGRIEDVEALLDVVRQIDHMLAQVMIETVILEITLSDKLSYGIDWLQRSMTLYDSETAGPGGGVPVGQPIVGYGGAFGGRDSKFQSGSSVNRDTPLSNIGLTYFMTFYDFNIDVILRAAASSGEARVLSTPVILTTDNTEASIISSEQRPIINQTSTTGAGEIRSSYEYRDIGIKLKVKPRINPDRVVVLEITQTADTPGEEVRIDDNLVPSIFRRELQATVAVPDRGTVALGGLIQDGKKKSQGKVPFLGDIPFLGWLFRTEDRDDARTELLVLITPYVITSPEEARRETVRMHDKSSTTEQEWETTWSDGDLARRNREKTATPINLRRRRLAGELPESTPEPEVTKPEAPAPAPAAPVPAVAPPVAIVEPAAPSTSATAPSAGTVVVPIP
jgi:general secretion pathway protein D